MRTTNLRITLSMTTLAMLGSVMLGGTALAGTPGAAGTTVYPQTKYRICANGTDAFGNCLPAPVKPAVPGPTGQPTCTTSNCASEDPNTSTPGGSPVGNPGTAPGPGGGIAP